MEDLPSAELQPCFLRLQWRICPWAEHSDIYIYLFIYLFIYWSFQQSPTTVKRMVKLEPYKLSAGQKPIIVQTRLHLMMCSPQIESIFLPLLTRQCPSSQGPLPSPTQSRTRQLILNVTNPRRFTHLAENLYGYTSTYIPFTLYSNERKLCRDFTFSSSVTVYTFIGFTGF